MSKSIHLRSALIGGLVAGLIVTALPAMAAAVGDALELGTTNTINQTTTLKMRSRRTALVVEKNKTGPVIEVEGKRNVVKITAAEGKAPILVNRSAGTAKNLSADLLDGKDSTAFLGTSDLVAAHAGGDQLESVTTTEEVLRSVTLTAPRDGVVIVNSAVNVTEGTAGDNVACSITRGTTLNFGFIQQWESAGINGSVAQLAGTRGFDVTAGELTVNLVCRHDFGASGGSTFIDSAMTAIFIPTT